MKIKIKNWAEFQPRKELKTMNWFRVNTRLPLSKKMYDLPISAKWLWITLLSLAAEDNTNGILDIDIKYIAFQSGCGKSTKSDLLLLEGKQLLKILPCQDQHESDTDSTRTRPENELTLHNVHNVHNEHNSTRSKKSAHANNTYDFNALYQLYPKKRGKSSGITYCEKNITTSEQYSNLKLAITHYSAYCKRTVADEKYIKLFSTFMNSWEDWIDAEAGTVNIPLQAEHTLTTAQKRSKNNMSLWKKVRDGEI